MPVKLVTQGDGLYADEYEEGKYTYKGANPNNYITFNNELWRILSKEVDGTYNIIKQVESFQNKYICQNKFCYWKDDMSTYYFAMTYANISNENEKYLISRDWYVGKVEKDNDDLLSQINDEKSEIWNKGNVGTITLSEYIRANSNVNECNSLYKINSNADTCKTTNWINSFSSFPIFVLTVFNTDGSWLTDNITETGTFGTSTRILGGFIYPAVHLNSNIELQGTGSESDPYKIIN